MSSPTLSSRLYVAYVIRPTWSLSTILPRLPFVSPVVPTPSLEASTLSRPFFQLQASLLCLLPCLSPVGASLPLSTVSASRLPRPLEASPFVNRRLFSAFKTVLLFSKLLSQACCTSRFQDHHLPGSLHVWTGQAFAVFDFLFAQNPANSFFGSFEGYSFRVRFQNDPQKSIRL
jgi:hypothetical protein